MKEKDKNEYGEYISKLAFILGLFFFMGLLNVYIGVIGLIIGGVSIFKKYEGKYWVWGGAVLTCLKIILMAYFYWVMI